MSVCFCVAVLPSLSHRETEALGPIPKATWELLLLPSFPALEGEELF